MSSKLCNTLLMASNMLFILFQVVACIVDEEQRIVGTGYNGMPRKRRSNVDNDQYPWGKDKNDPLNKHAFVAHAEMNAIVYSKAPSVRDCTIYVTLFPCSNCTKCIIQSGIKKVVYLRKKKDKEEENKPSERMLGLAGIKCEEFQHDTNKPVFEIDITKSDTSTPGHLHQQMK